MALYLISTAPKYSPLRAQKELLNRTTQKSKVEKLCHVSCLLWGDVAWNSGLTLLNNISDFFYVQICLQLHNVLIFSSKYWQKYKIIQYFSIFQLLFRHPENDNQLRGCLQTHDSRSQSECLQTILSATFPGKVSSKRPLKASEKAPISGKRGPEFRELSLKVFEADF